jgi:hypothetical protein
MSKYSANADDWSCDVGCCRWARLLLVNTSFISSNTTVRPFNISSYYLFAFVPVDTSKSRNGVENTLLIKLDCETCWFRNIMSSCVIARIYASKHFSVAARKSCFPLLLTNRSSSICLRIWSALNLELIVCVRTCCYARIMLQQTRALQE